MRLGYRTPARAHLSGLVEVEATQHLGSEEFNSSANGRGTYPAVVDPDNAEFNQAYVQWAPSAKTRLRVGRQRLAWDNQRFIGNSGWRQNEQTFDALDLQQRGPGGWQLRYGYLARALRVNGSDNPDINLAHWLLDAHLLGATHALGRGTLTGYAYFIENRTLPATSHRDLGLRYAVRREPPAASAGWPARSSRTRIPTPTAAPTSAPTTACSRAAPSPAAIRSRRAGSGWAATAGSALPRPWPPCMPSTAGPTAS